MRRAVGVFLVFSACLALAVGGLEAARRLRAPGQAPSAELVPLRTNAQGFREFRNPKDGSELVLIPAGPFVMGSEVYPQTSPPQRVDLGSYYLGTREVTNGQFKRFLDQTGHQLVASRWDVHYAEGLEDYPAVYVSWFDAVAYCRWAGMRLPTEAEWEKAARGPEGQKYPWGEKWDPERCNSMALAEPALVGKMLDMDVGRGTTPVGSFPSGASPYGVLDMLGNAVEWCSSAYRDYPYRATDGREQEDATSLRVLRGGCWFNQADTMTGYYRDKSTPEYWYFYNYVGFRVAMSAPDAAPR